MDISCIDKMNVLEAYRGILEFAGTLALNCYHTHIHTKSVIAKVIDKLTNLIVTITLCVYVNQITLYFLIIYIYKFIFINKTEKKILKKFLQFESLILFL